MMEIGLYLRVNRDGKWRPVDICELTEDEWDPIFDAETMDKDRVVFFLRAVVNWIRDNVAEARTD